MFPLRSNTVPQVSDSGSLLDAFARRLVVMYRIEHVGYEKLLPYPLPDVFAWLRGRTVTARDRDQRNGPTNDRAYMTS